MSLHNTETEKLSEKTWFTLINVNANTGSVSSSNDNSDNKSGGANTNTIININNDDLSLSIVIHSSCGAFYMYSDLRAIVHSTWIENTYRTPRFIPDSCCCVSSDTTTSNTDSATSATITSAINNSHISKQSKLLMHNKNRLKSDNFIFPVRNIHSDGTFVTAYLNASFYGLMLLHRRNQEIIRINNIQQQQEVVDTRIQQQEQSSSRLSDDPLLSSEDQESHHSDIVIDDNMRTTHNEIPEQFMRTVELFCYDELHYHDITTCRDTVIDTILRYIIHDTCYL